MVEFEQTDPLEELAEEELLRLLAERPRGDLRRDVEALELLREAGVVERAPADGAER